MALPHPRKPRLEQIVIRQRLETIRQLPVGRHHPAHRRRQIIVDTATGNPAKVLKRSNMAIQKRNLVAPVVEPDEIPPLTCTRLIFNILSSGGPRLGLRIVIRSGSITNRWVSQFLSSASKMRFSGESGHQEEELRYSRWQLEAQIVKTQGIELTVPFCHRRILLEKTGESPRQFGIFSYIQDPPLRIKYSAPLVSCGNHAV